MTRRRQRSRKSGAVSPHPAKPDRGGILAAWSLAGAVAAATLLVDVSAEAAFDAPKRLSALLGAALAAGALLVFAAPAQSGPAAGSSSIQRITATLALIGLGLAGMSALASPRGPASLDALRTVLLFGLFIPLGASRALDSGRWRLPVAGLLAGCAINTVVSLLQALDLFQPFALQAIAGRTSTGAYIGNEGQLALLLTLGAPLPLAALVFGRASATRWAGGAVLALFLAGLLVNLSFTALGAAACGCGLVLALLFGRRALRPGLTAVLVLAAGVALYPPFRGRLAEVAGKLQAGDWNGVLTNRLGPWAAAIAMTAQRPLLGWGPGTFASEFVQHRLEAELTLGQRLLIPRITSTFGEAHCDVLQAAAELGLPAAAALIAAGLLGLRELLRAVLRRPSSAERAVLLALLVTASVSALTWFPFQQVSAIPPLLLAVGRAWRCLSPEPDP